MDILSQIRLCLDAATSQPGLAKASVYQTEGYLIGIQGLPWETPAAVRPSPEDAAACFLHDVREGELPLRGRVKNDARDCLEAFRSAMLDAYPEAKEKPFARAVAKLWVRWLNALVALPSGRDAFSFSKEVGFRAGALLKAEYEEGMAGNFALFLLDKRIHLIHVRHFLRMRGWLVGTIEHGSRSADAGVRERSEILKANLTSIILRSLHNAGPGYAAEAVAKLSTLTGQLDQAIRNLAAVEPETSLFLRNNRATIITRALHGGLFDYGAEVTEKLPSALQDLNRRIETLDASSPEAADKLRATKRTLVYRALTNGRLDRLR